MADGDEARTPLRDYEPVTKDDWPEELPVKLRKKLIALGIEKALRTSDD